ncbi:deoxyguanosinetriphosphate triphosphohydrolase family protein [Acidicapsa acidisoli]|uniref:deoxyguanosinetriphosphate triphosphohydrolase family protein n=1 Tax=Acidicapsa acidisoli TaxID=1615681 RepID=UPI0021E0320C|nr:dNTP triphosphohydrolase [Acidicapsa acidisoli]
MEDLFAPDSPLAIPESLAVPDSAADPLSRRACPESAHPYRSPFVRDIGRILHAKAFRRLAGKTQVFTRRAAESDHSRSRLTHTLEVAQIARTMASTLGLNASLAEALALVHDIGHPPFGHAGEHALDEALRVHNLTFDHNLHALRIVTSFEERYAAFRGLNLTLGVREGIIKHSRDYPSDRYPELSEYFLDQLPPLEAQLIDLADEIAYLTADLEDGLGAGILDLAQVEHHVQLFAIYYANAQKEFPAAEPCLLSNEALKQMLNAFVTDLMQETTRQARSLGIHTLHDLRHASRRVAQLSPEMEDHRRQAKAYLYANLYQSTALEAEHAHADHIVKSLFNAWIEDPELLPPDHRARISEEGVARAVADYIAGMTDAYIEQAWQKHKEFNRKN